MTVCLALLGRYITVIRAFFYESDDGWIDALQQCDGIDYHFLQETPETALEFLRLAVDQLYVTYSSIRRTQQDKSFKFTVNQPEGEIEVTVQDSTQRAGRHKSLTWKLRASAMKCVSEHAHRRTATEYASRANYGRVHGCFCLGACAG
jgi:hypothetical protein